MDVEVDVDDEDVLLADELLVIEDELSCADEWVSEETEDCSRDDISEPDVNTGETADGSYPQPQSNPAAAIIHNIFFFIGNHFSG